MADNIDLTNFSEEELIQLNRRIVERLRSFHQGRCYKDLAQFKPSCPNIRSAKRGADPDGWAQCQWLRRARKGVEGAS
jgi:hypothetical protein